MPYVNDNALFAEPAHLSVISMSEKYSLFQVPVWLAIVSYMFKVDTEIRLVILGI